jgi:catechol-2,3-dioxygenase
LPRSFILENKSLLSYETTVNVSRLDDITYQKTIFFEVIAVRTSKVTYLTKSKSTFTLVDTCEGEKDIPRVCNLLHCKKLANSEFSY